MRIAIEWQKMRRTLIAFVAVSAFLAFINPYNAAGTMSYPAAFLYWLGMVGAGGLGGNLAVMAYKYIFPDGPRLVGLAISALMATVAVLIFIVVVTVARGYYVPLEAIPRLFFLILVISIAITAMSDLIDRAFANEDTPPETGKAVEPMAAFLERLPVKYRTAELHAISSEDHYLRVYTNLGEALILMRLADAVRELEGAAGAQVHRSWWIAKASIADEKRQNGRSLLVLKSGTEVPVSRSYHARAKELGLIT
ncbi:MAG: LytTR family transcriptional regulator DNA-binding domain-containing protein [Pseudomonadota bacterium]